MKHGLRVVFWGEDSFSNVVLLSLLKSGCRVQSVITPCYDNNIYKRLELTCVTNGIPFYRFSQINSPEVYGLLSKLKPELCVIAHFEKLIPADYFSLSSLGFINLHPSLLPFYRGMSPQHWPIINGEKETGVSVHYIDDGIDTGDIIVQKRIPLTSDMYVSDLQKEWHTVYSWIVVEAIERILQKAAVTRQRDLEGSYYGRLREKDCVISNDVSAFQAYNLIRGVSLPYKGAKYDKLRIYRARLNHDEELTARLKDRGIGIYDEPSFGKLLKLQDGILIIEKYKTE